MRLACSFYNSGMISAELLQQYHALAQGEATARIERSRVVMTGKDCQSFLHKFCTQDVLSRQAGEGGEAFLCNVQGKIAAYVYFFVDTNEIVLDSSPGQAEKIIAHLDRYVITEDVQFRDVSAKRLIWASVRPANFPLEESPQYSSVKFLNGGTEVMRRVPFLGPLSYFGDSITSKPDDIDVSPAAVEMLRIEAASPLYGIDITLDNLPQEVGRDAQAINFKKGCYLGQETVARIDALGHVNKHLVQVKFTADAIILPSQELTLNTKVIGKVTSTAWSPRLHAPLALAYVRREHAAVGTRLDGAEVVRI
jgi:folate-binding protein YgfZ